jgi:hypothetical protein
MCAVVALGTGVTFWMIAARQGCVPNLDAIGRVIVGLLLFHLCAGCGLLLGLLHAWRRQPNWWPVAANAVVIAAFWIVTWSWPC